jgi:hypothetical protein
LQKQEQGDLTDAIARGQVLGSALHLSKVVYEMRLLERPRTVCSDKDCIEFKDDKKYHKSLCHNPCSLPNIEVDKIQCPELINCAAFMGSQNCRHCGHSWQLHLHILWEPIETTVQVDDEMVSKRLTENGTHVEVMETALASRQKRIQKYEEERCTLQKAAGQFAVFLKNSSIKPYNDSKLEYLDHLIEEEKGKVQAGGSRKRLDDFTADRRQHVEETRTLREYFKAGANDKLLDQEGIDNLVQEIFTLDLTGDDLRKVANQLEDVQNRTAERAKASAVHASTQPLRNNVRRQLPLDRQRKFGVREAGLSFHEKLASQQQEQEQQQQQRDLPKTRARPQTRFADMRKFVWKRSFGILF